MRCNWWRWLWGIVPLLVLSWVAVQAEQGGIEADLRARAASALGKGGMGWASARFAGRDALLEGTADDEADPQRAADLLNGVWGVRLVDNKTELVPKVENYTWTAGRRGNRVRITGHVPNRATRHVILGVAKANFPGFEVLDRMATTRGVPSIDTWLGGVSFALKQLAGLKRGDVRLHGLGLSVMGESEDVAAYHAVKSALANGLPKGIKLVNDRVTAPVVSPFTWSAQLVGGRLVLSGYVPESGRAELLAAAKAGVQGGIVDQMQPGEGAPQGWGAAAAASVRELARLGTGSAEMKDAALTMSGLAGDGTVAEAVRGGLRAALPATIKLIDHIKVKEPPPPPPPPPVPEPPPPAASPPAPAKETEPAVPAKPETTMSPPATPMPPATSKPDAAASTPAAEPAPPRTASAAEIQAKACEDRLGGLAKSGQIVFGLASAELDATSYPTLDKLAGAAKLCPDMRIEVAGHASAEGSTLVNQQLSIQRAQSVVAYLVKAGVDAARLQAVGYGASQPIAPNDTDENMAKNRRIEFTVRPK